MARKPKTPPPAPALTLPAELTIYTVGELHPQWLAWLGGVTATPAEGAPVELQAAAVDQIDAAGVQLLLSLQRALATLGRRCRVRDASAVLTGACAALGLGDWLQAMSAAGAAA
jgi:ABC-type transporter Mla MlaB component